MADLRWIIGAVALVLWIAKRVREHRQVVAELRRMGVPLMGDRKRGGGTGGT